jgi:anthranilate phosphoribosyltransferase
MAERMLAVLEANGGVHAMVVFGHDGLDELTTVTTSTVLETILVADTPREYRRRSYEVDPRALGLAPAQLSDLRGGAPALNAELVRSVLAGEAGARREFVLLNSGAALVVAGLTDDLASGIELAAAVLDSGAVATTLERLVAASLAAAAEALV